MATDNSNAIYTAGEMQNTGKFSFNTTNINNASYIPSLDMCPTKAQITAAAKTGYTLTISTAYNAKQLVPSKDWSMTKNIGKLTIHFYTSALTSNTVLNGWRYTTSTLPSLKYSSLETGTSIFYCSPGTLNSTYTTGATLTLNTSKHSTWPIGSYLCYLVYICTTQTGYAVLSGYYEPSEASQLNSGTNVEALRNWSIQTFTFQEFYS